MKILLTGSRGFTGRNFAARAIELGHEIIPFVSDLQNAEAVASEVGALEYTHVVHLAAISFVGHADEHAFYGVNLFGTLNLLKALAAAPNVPQFVLLASSANVYGNSLQSPITEEAVPSPVNHYAMSKLAMEHMAKTYAERLPLMLARPFNYTGPGQALSFLIPKLVHHFRRKSPVIELGNMDVAREFNDVSFVVDAYLKLLEQGKAGQTYNICTGRPHALRSVIQCLEAQTGHHPECRVNPAFVRSNEVVSLCGNPSRLRQAIGEEKHYTLHETLATMLLAEEGDQASTFKGTV